jgi:hypothetical protein
MEIEDHYVTWSLKYTMELWGYGAQYIWLKSLDYISNW